MDYAFTTDGCSGGHSARWRIFFKGEPPWQDCCIAHDREYWQGGTSEDRQKADQMLFDCVNAKGGPFWAWLLWSSVRPGGHPWLPVPWRWGYGWKYPHHYAPRSLSEQG